MIASVDICHRYGGAIEVGTLSIDSADYIRVYQGGCTVYLDLGAKGIEDLRVAISEIDRLTAAREALKVAA